MPRDRVACDPGQRPRPKRRVDSALSRRTGWRPILFRNFVGNEVAFQPQLGRDSTAQGKSCANSREPLKGRDSSGFNDDYASRNLAPLGLQDRRSYPPRARRPGLSNLAPMGLLARARNKTGVNLVFQSPERCARQAEPVGPHQSSGSMLRLTKTGASRLSTGAKSSVSSRPRESSRIEVISPRSCGRPAASISHEANGSVDQ